jgi:WD40 repeat protein
MSYLYLKSPIFSVVSRKGGGASVLASACGGSSKTGIPNLLVAFRCEGANREDDSSSDDIDDVSDGCSTVLIKDQSLETGYDVEHLKLTTSESGKLVAALCGNADCRLYSWKEISENSRGGIPTTKSSLQVIGTFNVTRSEIEASSVSLHGENTLAIGDISGNVHIWQLKHKSTNENDDIKLIFVGRLMGHKAKVTSLQFDKSGETLVTASDDDTLRVWELGHLSKPLTNSSSTSNEQILCHVIHGRGKSDLGNQFVNKSKSKSTILRWKFRGVSMKPDGCSLFALETSDSGGAVLVKWRTISEKESTKSDDIQTMAPFEFVSLDGKINPSENPAIIGKTSSDARIPAKRWIFSLWTVASQTPASALASNSTFNRLAVGSNDGSVRLFDSDIFGSPLWIRKDVHQMSVTCVAFVENEDEQSIVTGSADAQLALLPIKAPAQKINPRAVVIILFMITLILAGGSFYRFVLDNNELIDNGEL